MDKWAHLVGFKPSKRLDEKIFKMRKGQRANLTKMGISKKIIEESIRRSEKRK